MRLLAERQQMITTVHEDDLTAWYHIPKLERVQDIWHDDFELEEEDDVIEFSPNATAAIDFSKALS